MDQFNLFMTVDTVAGAMSSKTITKYESTATRREVANLLL